MFVVIGPDDLVDVDEVFRLCGLSGALMHTQIIVHPPADFREGASELGLDDQPDGYTISTLDGVSTLGTATLLNRAIKRRCPNCGRGKVYRGLTQQKVCTHCSYRYSREYGYFLGALIVTYAVIGGLALAAMLTLATLGASVPIALGVPLAAGLLAVPVFVPFSHTLWMALDLRFDPPRPEDFEPGASND